MFKGSIDQCLKSEEIEKNKVCNGSTPMILENIQLSNGQQSVGVENETSKLKEVNEDESVKSNQIEIKENLEVEENEPVKCDTIEVIVIDDPEKSIIKPLCIDNALILEQTSKKDIRQKVWEFLEENSLVVFPKPCFNRIPNFKGCSNASQSLEKLEEFKKAKTIQVTPDKAQETARFLTLSVSKQFI